MRPFCDFATFLHSLFQGEKGKGKTLIMKCFSEWKRFCSFQQFFFCRFWDEKSCFYLLFFLKKFEIFYSKISEKIFVIEKWNKEKNPSCIVLKNNFFPLLSMLKEYHRIFFHVAFHSFAEWLLWIQRSFHCSQLIKIHVDDLSYYLENLRCEKNN